MNIEDTGTIKLKLGLGTEISDLKKLIESEGIKEGFKIKVAERMEARLSGQNFWITAITPEVQGGVPERNYHLELGSKAKGQRQAISILNINSSNWNQWQPYAKNIADI